MNIPFHRIAERLYNTPLLVAPQTAEMISAFMLQRMAAGDLEMRGGRGGDDNDSGGETRQHFEPTRAKGGAIESHTPRMSRFHGDYVVEEGSGRPLPYRRTQDGTAIITCVGEFVNRGAWVGASSGLISYEGFKFQAQKAAADKSTQHILLDFESPGGEAVGAFEAAAVVREVAKIKPVTALVNGMAASAAYAIASGASRIVTIPTGISGSIGVVMLHLDISAALAKAGIKPTFIFCGDHKVDGNAYEPLPDEVREDFQQQIESFYDQFVKTVAMGRPGLSEKQIRATEARVFKGQDAVDAGLADSVGTIESVLAEISRGPSSGRLTPSETTKGPMMENNPSASAANPAGNPTQPAATAQPAANLETVRAEAAAAERKRIADIDAVSSAPAHKAIVDAHKSDPSKTAGDCALAIVAADKQTRGTALSAIADVETAAAPLKAAASAAGADGGKPKANDPAGWKAEWDASPELQGEFPSGSDSYAAFMQGVADGRIHVLRSKSA